MASIFSPHYGTTQTLSVGATSSTDILSKESTCLKITNTGANTAFVHIGDSLTVIATNSDMPILAGETIYIHKKSESDGIAHKTSVTTTLLITEGEGHT